MKSARLQRYLRNKAQSKAAEETVEKSKDQHIDQDFPGYPHGTARKETIRPKTKNQEKTAAIDTKDGEKMNTTPAKKRSQQKEEDDGSGNAFEGTETVKE